MITSYDTMPFGIFIKVLDIIEDKDRSPLDVQVGLIAALERKAEDWVLDLPVTEFRKRAAQLDFLTVPAPEPKPVPLPRVLKIGGFDLRTVDDPAKMNTSQFVDYEALIRQGRKAYPALLSVFLVPYGKVYGHTGDDDPKAYDVEAVRTAIAEELTVVQVEGAAAFFLKRWRSALSRSLTSLRRRVERLVRGIKDPALTTPLLRRLKDLERRGDGLTR